MKLPIALLLLAGSAGVASATQVVDDFESGTNPNQWGWTDVKNGPVAVINPVGGNPGAWADSDVPYFADHPNFTAVPPDGSPLRAALASGTLHSLSIDVQRLGTDGVTGCGPIYTTPSTFSLALFDRHTTGPGNYVIEAYTTDGAVSPTDGPFPWQTATFTIPSDATNTPPGWVLKIAPGDHYTWADLMHNIDGISVLVVNPADLTYSSCWHLGADNVVVSYGSDDSQMIFADGFDGAARP
jgi:hypothetical protein